MGLEMGVCVGIGLGAGGSHGQRVAGKRGQTATVGLQAARPVEAAAGWRARTVAVGLNLDQAALGGLEGVVRQVVAGCGGCGGVALLRHWRVAVGLAVGLAFAGAAGLAAARVGRGGVEDG